MKTPYLVLAFFTLLLLGCGGGADQRSESPETDDSAILKQEEVHGEEVETVELSNPLDQAMVAKGEEIYDLKCSACHKLDDMRIVGPGWQGVTQRRKPTWIINMITNVDMMLAEDAEAQKMLEECLVRMPNQNVTSDDARALLEFMRKNDGEI
ncbi:Cytochrome c [Spirosomataceae bacterium TFI 002]|nr:Cytochrome c [Spirosomataceae bacterium TFI 002]